MLLTVLGVRNVLGVRRQDVPLPAHLLEPQQPLRLQGAEQFREGGKAVIALVEIGFFADDRLFD